MTHRQASFIALKRLGLSKTQILEMHAAADRCFDAELGSPRRKSVDEPVKLKPGQTEEQYIEGVMLHAAMCMKAGPQVVGAAMETILTRVRAENESN